MPYQGMGVAGSACHGSRTRGRRENQEEAHISRCPVRTLWVMQALRQFRRMPRLHAKKISAEIPNEATAASFSILPAANASHKIPDKVRGYRFCGSG